MENNNQNKNDFEYRYSAPSAEERKEIESIRKNYLNEKKEPSKLELLRKLDWKVKNVPVTLALIVGIVGTLIFGLGMAMILEWNFLVLGIIVCFVGAIPCAFGYPTYKISTARMKEKYSAKILKLSEELLNETENKTM